MLDDPFQDLFLGKIIAALLHCEDDVESVHDQQHLRFRRGARPAARRVMGQYPSA